MITVYLYQTAPVAEGEDCPEEALTETLEFTELDDALMACGCEIVYDWPDDETGIDLIKSAIPSWDCERTGTYARFDGNEWIPIVRFDEINRDTREWYEAGIVRSAAMIAPMPIVEAVMELVRLSCKGERHSGVPCYMPVS